MGISCTEFVIGLRANRLARFFRADASRGLGAASS
jgi:hypothetical protein